jgi:hypothetical protein
MASNQPALGVLKDCQLLAIAVLICSDSKGPFKLVEDLWTGSQELPIESGLNPSHQIT